MVAVAVQVPASRAMASPTVTVGDTTLVRSTGALLSWQRFQLPDQATWRAYEMHRSRSARFDPEESTLVATLTDLGRTTYQDTTAAPDTTWKYRIVARYVLGGKPAAAVSAPVEVTTPRQGAAVLTVAADTGSGRSTTLRHDQSEPAACDAAANWGADPGLTVGTTPAGVVSRTLLHFDLRRIPAGAEVTSARLALRSAEGQAAGTAVDVLRMTRPWTEGSEAGTCGGTGASWLEASNGIRWSTAGGDVGGASVGRIAATARTGGSTDTVDVTSAAKSWLSGRTPNHGLLLKATEESVPAAANLVRWHSDDAASSSERPHLTVTFEDSAAPAGARISIGSPAAGDVVRGTTDLTAGVTDDGKVRSVEFQVDGATVGRPDTAAPYEVSWNSATAARGEHRLRVRVTDDAGIVTTSEERRFTVDNQVPPTGSMNPVSSPVTGARTLYATANDDVDVARVEFVVDGNEVGIGSPVGGGSYAYRWNTLHPLSGTYDGEHTVQAFAVDTAGQRTQLGSQSVTVANVGDQPYSARLVLNDPATSTDDVVPPLLTDNTDPGAVEAAPDTYNGTVDADGLWSGDRSLGPSLTSGPKDSTRSMRRAVPGSSSTAHGAATSSRGWVAPPAVTCPAEAYCPAITVTNTGDRTWHGDKIRLWYRWYTPTGAVAFEGPAPDTLGNAFPKGRTKSFRLVVYPPALPVGAGLAQYRLRIDLYDTESGTWFSEKGNQPLDQPVTVAKAQKEKLGFEKFLTYEGGQVGAGAVVASNVANGNFLWRWSPWTSPGRGLATVLDLTYNSLEDHSRSPVGESFSLAISGLSRLGEPIEIHPNKADEISGKAKKYVEFVDGDGTVHRFEGQPDGTWKRPPGVHLYLRTVSSDPAAERYWAISRPDGVTFFYTRDGFPSAVSDKNGNAITFVREDTPPGEDPGGPKQRLTKVVDAGGRAFTVDYLSKDEEKNGRVRGKVQRITDHTGSALDFEYYTDGNLRKVIQRGGVGDDGASTPDRSFVFTYTTSSGSGPAIPDAADRVDPDARTPNQSTKVFSVADPRGHETTLTYYGAQPDPKLRWKIKSRTDRRTADGAETTQYAYDLTNRVTTVRDGLGKPTTYGYDTLGRVTRITNAKNESTSYEWSADNHSIGITEPNGAKQTFAYNDAGYLTQRTNQEGETTRLTYTVPKPYLFLLDTVTEPLGVASATDGDYETKFTYDAVGNIATQTDQAGKVTTYAWNGPGTPNAGTLASVRDPKGNLTTFPSYDANGQATAVRDAEDQVTKFAYTDDGLLRWTQTPLHAAYEGSGLPERHYRTFTDYDAFHRLVRTSTPKSTQLEPGMLLWSGKSYDANNNVTVQRSPTYGVGEPDSGPVSTIDFDEMDRPTKVVGADKAAGEEAVLKDYDLLGRMVSETAPNGAASPENGDYTVTFTYDVLDRVVGQKRQGKAGEQPRRSWLCFDNVGNRVASIQPKAGLEAAPTACPTTPQPWTTLMHYDKAHRSIGATDPEGRRTSQTYDANGLVVSSTNESGTKNEIAYDQRGLVVEQRTQVTDTKTITSRRQYDDNGNVVKEIGARAVDKGTTTDHVTTYTYDKVNRPIRIGLPKDSKTDAAFEHTVYDADGRMVTKTLPIASETLPAELGPNAKNTFRYFDTGWIAGSTQAAHPEVLFDYTPEGWQAERVPRQTTDPNSPRNEALRMSWEYFADGKVKSRMDEHGLPVTYRYDRNNNLVEGLVTAGVVDPKERAIQTTVEYDGFDQVVRSGETKLVDDPAKRVTNFTTYGYDIHGLLTSRGDEGRSGAVTEPVKRNEFAYDGVDRLVTQWELGRDTSCAGDHRILTSWTGEDWLGERSIQRATGACGAEKSSEAEAWQTTQVETKTYLRNGELDSSETKNGQGAVKEQHKLSYTEQDGAWVGQRTKDEFQRVTPTAGKPCSASTCTQTWTFDARNKLIGATDGHGGTYTYTLDEPDKQADSLVRAGNVTTETGPQGTSTKEYSGNQMVKATSGGQTTKTIYDDLGRTDCVVKAEGSAADCNTGGAVSANLITDYAYDYLDRMSATRSYANGELRDETTYQSDALDRVVHQEEMHKAAGTERRTVDFTFLGVTEHVSSEKSVSTGSKDDPAAAGDESLKSFSYDAYGSRLRITDATRVKNADGSFEPAKETSATYAYDPHSSVSLLLHDSGDSAGAVKASYGYTPYGDTDDALTDGDTDKKKPFNPFRYTGQRWDSGSQTLKAGSRNYDPGSTRFLQQDVFKSALGDLGLSTDPLSQNRYALAGGNPTSFIEFDGHMLMANGGGGGSVPTQPDTGGDGAPKDGPSQEEIDKAKKTEKDFDWGKKLIDLGLDFLGFNDIKDCINNPSFGSCAMAIANFIPWGKIFKAGKIAKRVWDLIGEFRDWQKARRYADDVLRRAEEASKKSDGAATKADNPGTSCKLPNSFRSGTRVVMADGSRRPIEQVKRGDKVKAVDPKTGKVTSRTVTATITKHGDKQVTRVVVDTSRLDKAGVKTAGSGQAMMLATDGHPVWEAKTGRWVEAGKLRVGDLIRTADGRLLPVAAVTVDTIRTTVHNLSVAIDHTYLVQLTSGGGGGSDDPAATALAHNCPDGGDAGKGAGETAAKAEDAGSVTGKTEPAGASQFVQQKSKTYQTYTKTHPKTGKVYTGRTSGTGSPRENIARRDAGHHKNAEGYGPAVLDKSSSNPAAIRGREQQLIDANGGAQSMGGTSGNAINGIRADHPRRDEFLAATNEEFG